MSFDAFRPQTPYAPATPPLEWALRELTPAEMKRELRHCKRVVRRLDWRRRYNRKCSFLMQVLRRGERALGDGYAGRARHDQTWVLFAWSDAGRRPVVEVTTPILRTWADFERPVVVRVMEPAFLDMQELERELRGLAANDITATSANIDEEKTTREEGHEKDTTDSRGQGSGAAARRSSR